MTRSRGRVGIEQVPIAILLLIPSLLFVLIYARSLDYDFVWTDQGEIEHGLLILPPGEIHTAFARPMLSGLPEHLEALSVPYYRPMQVVAASWIDDRFGRQPRNFRLLNLLLGAATCFAVGWIGWLLSRDHLLALLAGGSIAVHPANIENYVWIAGLSHALAALFIAGGLGFAILAVTAARRAQWLGYGALSIVSLLLALASKENAVVLPLLWFACAISLVFRERRLEDEGTSAASGDAPPLRTRAIAITLLQLVITVTFVLLWRPHVLGEMFSEATPLMGSMRIQIVTSVAYWTEAIGWLVLPIETTTSDVVRLRGSPFDPAFLAGLLLVVLSVVIWLRLLRGGREIAALGLAWIWIAFAPTSGIVPLNHLRGERYLALSLFGLALLLPSIVAWLIDVNRDRRKRIAFGVLLLALLALYAQRTWQRIPDWRSDLTLFEADVAASPLYREGYHELAKARLEAGDHEGAKQSLDTLSTIGEDFLGHTSFLRTTDAVELHCIVNLNLDRAGDNLRYFDSLSGDAPEVRLLPGLAICGARSLDELGRNEQARGIYEVLVSLGPTPWWAEAVVALARIHLDAGRVDEARQWLARVERGEIRDPEVLARYTRLRGELRSQAPRSR